MILKLILQNKHLPKLKDTNKHQGLRNQLAKVLEEKGITDKNVLEAIKKIPRHLFLNSSFEDFAYQDKPAGIGFILFGAWKGAFKNYAKNDIAKNCNTVFNLPI